MATDEIANKGGSYIAFYDLALEIMFRIILAFHKK